MCVLVNLCESINCNGMLSSCWSKLQRTDAHVATQEWGKMHERYLRFRAVRPFQGFANQAGNTEVAPASSKRFWLSYLSLRTVRKPRSEEATADIESSGDAADCNSRRSGVLGEVCFASSGKHDLVIHESDRNKIAFDAERLLSNPELSGTSKFVQQDAVLGFTPTSTATETTSDYTCQIMSCLDEEITHTQRNRHTGLNSGSSGFVRLMRSSTPP